MSYHSGWTGNPVRTGTRKDTTTDTPTTRAPTPPRWISADDPWLGDYDADTGPDGDVDPDADWEAHQDAGTFPDWL